MAIVLELTAGMMDGFLQETGPVSPYPPDGIYKQFMVTGERSHSKLPMPLITPPPCYSKNLELDAGGACF